MKTSINFRNIATVATICLALTMISLPGNAQKSGKNEYNNKERNNGHERRDDRNKYNNKDGYHPQKNDYRESKSRGRNAYAESNFKNDYRYNYSRRAPWGNHKPMVMNHRNGHVYFYGGRYYEYHPHRGYILINYPVNYVFNELPYGYRKVWIDGQYYFRYGDTFFRPVVHGYVVVQLPRQLVITGNF